MNALTVYRSNIEQAMIINARYMGCDIDHQMVLEDGHCWLAHDPLSLPLSPDDNEATPSGYGRNLEDVLIRYIGPDVSITALPDIEEYIARVLFFNGKYKVVLIDDGDELVPAYPSLFQAVNSAIYRQKHIHNKRNPNANL